MWSLQHDTTIVAFASASSGITLPTFGTIFVGDALKRKVIGLTIEGMQ